MQEEKIRRAVYAAIDEVNQLRPLAERLEKSEQAVLLGVGSRLDSLSVVNLIVATEMNLEEAFGVSLDLADERAMAQAESPYRTVGAFITYISGLVQEKVHDS